MSNDQPNVLFIQADQLKAQVLPGYGGAAVTPHLDRLCEEGVVFENAYCNFPRVRPRMGVVPAPSRRLQRLGMAWYRSIASITARACAQAPSRNAAAVVDQSTTAVNNGPSELPCPSVLNKTSRPPAIAHFSAGDESKIVFTKLDQLHPE